MNYNPHQASGPSRYERVVRSLGSIWIFAALVWPLKKMLRRLGIISTVKSLLGGSRAPRTALEPGVSSRFLPPVDIGRGVPTTESPLAMSLIGGWGYGNLGDEAILAGYVLEAKRRNLAVEVLSVDPRTTAACQGPVLSHSHGGVRLEDESLAVLRRRSSLPLVVAGGGYLNGSWYTEVSGKLRRLRSLARGRPVIFHSTELRGIGEGRLARDAARVLTAASVSVRDRASADQAREISGVVASIVPDAISLLFNNIGDVTYERADVAGALLVNLLDIPARNDSHEAEFSLANWRDQCRVLVSQTSRRVIGLALDVEDTRFMREELSLEVITPATVSELTSTLASAYGLVSTRMHPALVSTMLAKPTRVLPYCGKVRPTLRRLGLEQITAMPGDAVRNLTSHVSTDFHETWERNYSETSQWLFGEVLKARQR